MRICDIDKMNVAKYVLKLDPGSNGHYRSIDLCESCCKAVELYIETLTKERSP